MSESENIFIFFELEISNLQKPLVLKVLNTHALDSLKIIQIKLKSFGQNS